MLARCGRAAVVVVLLAAAAEWVSWTTIKQPALASSAWPEVTPWAVLCLATRYHILGDNAVDVVVRLRDSEIAVVPQSQFTHPGSTST